MLYSSYQFFATTPLGMEDLLTQELQEMGIREVRKERAGASFRGTLEAGYRCCLWSRVANRVLLTLSTFSARTPEELYEGVYRIQWSDHLSALNTLAVEFVTTLSAITHTHYGALKVKDAIVDQFRATQQTRPSIQRHQPDLAVYVYLLKDQATVSIDLSGESLHRRGYREEGALAPLKENLAAALLKLAEWPRPASEEIEAFLDPMCGSGTLLIEAAGWPLERLRVSTDRILDLSDGKDMFQIFGFDSAKRQRRSKLKRLGNYLR